jgi:DNA-binding transcriptional regulator LsrR (DeoR family)
MQALPALVLFALFKSNHGGIETLEKQETSKINISGILRERFTTGLTQSEIGGLFGLSWRRVGQILADIKGEETSKINTSPFELN